LKKPAYTGIKLITTIHNYKVKMQGLTTIDYILVLAYFIALLSIGYVTSKRETEEGFLIADRKLGTWSTMATVNASKTGSILMIFVAMVYVWGFSALWYFIGMSIGVLIYIPFAVKLKRESQQRYYTLADYFRYNYGKKTAFFASAITIFLMFGYMIMNLIAGTKIFVYFTNWPFWICAIIMVLIVMTYLLLGGFKAVVKTDMLQYIAMIFIIIILLFVMIKSTTIAAADWNLFKADIGTMVGFFLLGIMFPFALPDLWQRVYAAKNRKALVNGLLLSVVIYFGFALLLGIVALTVKAKFPNIDPDLALIHGLSNMVPSGLIGLAVVLLFSAIMSSVDTYIFTGASIIVQDFTNLDKRRTVKNIKIAIVVLALLGTFVGILIQGLLMSAYIFAAFMLVIATAVLATWIRKRIKPFTLQTGFCVGIVALIILLIKSIAIEGEIQPTMVIAGIILTIIGLIAGGIISKFRQPSHSF